VSFPCSKGEKIFTNSPLHSNIFWIKIVKEKKSYRFHFEISKMKCFKSIVLKNSTVSSFQCHSFKIFVSKYDYFVLKLHQIKRKI